MSPRDFVKTDNLLRLGLTIAVIIGAIVTLRIWPVRERVSLNAQAIQANIDCLKELKLEVAKRPSTETLQPRLDMIQKQLDDLYSISKDQVKYNQEIYKLLADINARIPKSNRRDQKNNNGD